MSIQQELHEAHKARLARMQPKRSSPPVPNALMAQALLIIDAFEHPKVAPAAPVVPRHDARLSIRAIQAATETYFGITYSELCSPRRTKAIVYARWIGMYVCKLETVRSIPEIGRRFGGRDHSTVFHALQTIDANYSRYEADINAVREIARAPIDQRSIPQNSTASERASDRIPTVDRGGGEAPISAQA